jgi:hypothetical protein
MKVNHWRQSCRSVTLCDGANTSEPVRHRRAVDPEIFDRHPMRWRFLGIVMVRSHAESPAGNPDHVIDLAVLRWLILTFDLVRSNVMAPIPDPPDRGPFRQFDSNNGGATCAFLQRAQPTGA